MVKVYHFQGCGTHPMYSHTGSDRPVPRWLTIDGVIQPIKDALVEQAHSTDLAVLLGALLCGEEKVLLRAGEGVVHGPGIVKELVVLRVTHKRRATDAVRDTLQRVPPVPLEVAGRRVEPTRPHPVGQRPPLGHVE